MEYIVDRFEEGIALLEPAQGPLRTEMLPRAQLPAETREGDVLVLENDVWRVDAEATAARRDKLRRRFERCGK